MSDITGGPPIPKTVQPVSHGTDKAARVARDKQHTNEHTRQDSGKENKAEQQGTGVNARDPAVSISASAAHLQVGEELKQKVTRVDAEGRPVIETETATFALRPDAGLKAGDDVTLIVRDTHKQLTADLLRRNDTVIDPPIRLNLTVIAFHSSEPLPQKPAPVAETEKPLSSSYRPNQTSTVSAAPKQGGEAEALARLLGRTPTLQTPQTTSAEQTTAPSRNFANNPPTAANMATLISAQQKATAIIPPITASPTDAGLGSQPAAPNHILPSSPLTEITATAIAAAAGSINTGLGPMIPAVMMNGVSKTLQLLDPSISKVIPSEVATVMSVQPLSTTDARTLPVTIASLGNNSALARVETNVGVFVLNQTDASALNGELVRVSPPAPTSTGAALTPRREATTYTAQLLSKGASQARPVSIQFLKSDDGPPLQANDRTVAAPANNIPVTAVHTLRAYLTPDGPKSDIRVETPLGDFSTTLANSARPIAGDIVSILPPQADASAAAHAASTAVTPPSTTVSATAWPAFEQAAQTLGAVSTEAAQSLVARTAQGGAKLANSAVFLLSALGSSGGANPSNWLGKAAEKILGERNSRLLDTLKGDIGRLFNMAADTSGEWRALLLPLDIRSNDVPMLAFLYSQGSALDPDDQNTDKNDKGKNDEKMQRFILEVQFSVLGAVQLDGSIQGQRFDLMVRSERQFSPQLTQDTSNLFSAALTAGAFTGSLGFSVEDTFPVDVAAVLEKI
ncbi:MAG: hypothetical protein JKY34_01480 [Kordiimonadaceae bacterium]|nr:hypothetical protein [Kordiimonadaceae bacterium]